MALRDFVGNKHSPYVTVLDMANSLERDRILLAYRGIFTFLVSLLGHSWQLLQYVTSANLSFR
jgi:hypothetical protein